MAVPPRPPKRRVSDEAIRELMEAGLTEEEARRLLESLAEVSEPEAEVAGETGEAGETPEEVPEGLPLPSLEEERREVEEARKRGAAVGIRELAERLGATPEEVATALLELAERLKSGGLEAASLGEVVGEEEAGREEQLVEELVEERPGEAGGEAGTVSIDVDRLAEELGVAAVQVAEARREQPRVEGGEGGAERQAQAPKPAGEARAAGRAEAGPRGPGESGGAVQLPIEELARELGLEGLPEQPRERGVQEEQAREREQRGMPAQPAQPQEQPAQQPQQPQQRGLVVEVGGSELIPVYFIHYEMPSEDILYRHIVTETGSIVKVPVTRLSATFRSKASEARRQLALLRYTLPVYKHGDVWAAVNPDVARKLGEAIAEIINNLISYLERHGISVPERYYVRIEKVMVPKEAVLYWLRRSVGSVEGELAELEEMLREEAERRRRQRLERKKQMLERYREMLLEEMKRLEGERRAQVKPA